MNSCMMDTPVQTVVDVCCNKCPVQSRSWSQSGKHLSGRNGILIDKGMLGKEAERARLNAFKQQTSQGHHLAGQEEKEKSSGRQSGITT